MLRFCEKCKGTISVFLTLILIPTFIFGGVLVDGSRVVGAKNLISGAGDLAMNAALSGYHEELNQTYGLLAMAKTADEVDDIMKDFFETTLNANGVSGEDFSKALVYLELTNDDFTVSNIPGTEIYETEVIKQEILEYMKYRAPATLINRAITDKLGDLENIEKEKKAADAQIKFESELDDLQTLFDDIKELTDRQEEIYADMKDEAGLNDMLSRSKLSYEEITMLAVAYFRMLNCSETEQGDTKSLMNRMVELSCDVSNIDAAAAENIIKMIMVKNAMNGRNTNEVLEGLDAQSDEYAQMQQLISDYEAADAVREEGIENTGKQLDALVSAVYLEMSTQRKLAVEGEENCGKILEKLEKLKEEFEKLRGKYENWKSAVNDLPEGESKKAYQENLNEVSGFFEAEGMLAAFEQKINQNQTFYGEVWRQLDNVTFTGLTLDESLKEKGQFMGEADYGSITTASEITSCGADFMVRYHDIGTMQLSEVNQDLSQDEFVKKLKDIWCNYDDADEGRANSEADKWDKDLSKYMEKLQNLLLTDDISELNVNTIAQGQIPSVWLGISQYQEQEGDGAVNVEGGLKEKGERKKVSNSGSDNLNKDNSSISEMSGLAKKVAGAGETVAEPLILTEYVMGMFSHYVCNKDTEGKAVEPESLTRSKLSENALYRAEIEYILWGSPDTRDNVGITKAIIFAANLVFNMSFAFTNKTIKTDAFTIANLFPVGPMARTAIKCALQSMVGLIETTRNMVDLMDGKAVPLLKSASAWDTWILTKGGTKSKDAGGFTYDDYLWILVCVKMFIPSQQRELLARTADCIELNMTDSKSNADNTLYDMYTMIDLEADVSIDTFFLQKLSGAGYNVQAVDDETFKIQYYGVQGY